jgi:preprotein translocase SecE subunit
LENQRAVGVLFIIGGVLAGVFARSLTLAVMTYAALEDPLLAGIAPVSAVIAVAVAIVTPFILLRSDRARTFTDEVVTELRRVTWPSREETFGNTGIVVGATVFFATLLSVYDLAWAKLTGIFLYTTG